MKNNKLVLIIALILVLFVQSCRVDIADYFKDYKKVDQLCISHQDTFKSEKYDCFVGFKHENDQDYSVLRYTFTNVKVSLADSLLKKRSKIFTELVYNNLKNKDQFDKFEILLLSESPQDIKIDTNLTFKLDRIKFSFDAIEFEDKMY
jgi:hypothetical protein